MRYFLMIITFWATNLKAQTGLNFDKRYVESEDKWVVFKINEDSSYTYGFIYIDPEAGLTFNYEGNFKIVSGKYIPEKMKETNIKMRLMPNKALVAFIPENRFPELQITAVPEWLKHYKTDTNSVQRLYNWGYRYNAWNECKKALTYLEKAMVIEPEFEGLAAELAFSYNCLKQYDKAEQVLQAAIKTNTEDAYLNKEYIYTLAKNNKIDSAIKLFNISVKQLKDKNYNAENCYNILQYYYLQKDKDNFNLWYKELKKYPSGNEMISQYAEAMRKELGK